MAAEITWLGHNAWEMTIGKHRVLLDPFLDDSPVAPKKSGGVEADFILVSHGHFDHIADVAKIAKRTGAVVVANFEIVEWLKKEGVAAENTVSMNIGGHAKMPFGRVKMTLAHHSSGLPDGTYGGTASGFLIDFAEGKRVYFACDTSLFLDMKLIGTGGLDWAIVPIGDLFTMGPDDSIEAIKLLGPKKVVPCHYSTWPPIEQDASIWAEAVRRDTAAEPVVLAPGECVAV